MIAVVTVKTTTSTDSRSCWHEATTEEGLGFQLPVVQPNPEGMSCSNPHACFNRFKLCEAFYSSMDLPRRASANPSWRGNAEEGHVHTSAGKLLQHLSRPRQTHLFLEAPSIALRHQVHQAFKTCFPFTWRALAAAAMPFSAGEVPNSMAIPNVSQVPAGFCNETSGIVSRAEIRPTRPEVIVGALGELPLAGGTGTVSKYISCSQK